MSSFGKTLKDAREAKGLTCSQVAAQTHMLIQTVEEMEREDFHRIPAPIYGRGFVRLFAECVGLDPVPLVREFMEIYEGRRAPTVNIREVPTMFEPTPPAPKPEPEAPPPSPAPEPEPKPVPPPPAPEPELEPEPEPEPEPKPVSPPPASKPEPEPKQEIEPPSVIQGLDLFEQPQQHASDDAPLFPPKDATPASDGRIPPPIDLESSPFLPSDTYDEGGPTAAERFRKSLSAISSGVINKVQEIPRRVWRITALALLAIATLAFIAWSVGKLYEATSVPPSPQPTAVVKPITVVEKEIQSAIASPASKPKTPPKASTGKLKSTGQPIPNILAD